MGIAEAVLSMLVATVVPSLYEESSRVKVAKGTVLIGIILILLDVLHPVFREPYLYAIVLVTSVLLAVGSIHVSGMFGELFSDILLDTYLCLYAGENCEMIIREEKNSIESLINCVSDLLAGKWTPLGELLEEITKSKNFKVVTKLSAYALLYQASSLSLALFIVLILEVLGIADAIALTVEMPLALPGVIFIVFGVVLSATTMSTPEENVTQSAEEPRQTLQLISAEAYRKMLLMPHRNRLKRALVRLATIISTANPNYMKPKLELPFVTPVNLYECSPRLGDIIDELKRLEKHGYTVEIYGDPSSIYGERLNDKGCKDSSGVSKFIALHHEKSSLDIFKELMLISKENIVYGAKILVRELKSSRLRAGKRRNGINDEKPGRLVAVMVIKAWKGCVKYTRIRRKSSSVSKDKGKEMYVETRIESRRILSIFVVGRRGLASLINIKVLAYLRPASVENVLCVDDEIDLVTST